MLETTDSPKAVKKPTIKELRKQVEELEQIVVGLDKQLNVQDEYCENRDDEASRLDVELKRLEQLVLDRDDEASTLGRRLKNMETQVAARKADIKDRDNIIKARDNIIAEQKKPKGPNIFERMLGIMGDVQYLKKEYNANVKHTVVTHDDVSDAVRKAAIKHRVFIHTTTAENSTNLIPRPSKYDTGRQVSYTEIEVLVTFINVDDPEDNINCRFLGAGEGADCKTPGAAYSFAVKTALLKTFLIPTGEEEEEAHLEKAMTPAERHEAVKGKLKVKHEAKMMTAASDKARIIANSDDKLKALCQERGFRHMDTLTWIEQTHEKKWLDMELTERQRAYKNVRNDYEGTADAEPTPAPTITRADVVAGQATEGDLAQSVQEELEGHEAGEKQQSWQDQG